MKRYLGLFIISIGLSLIIMAVVLFIRPAISFQRDSHLPASIAGQPMTSSLTGQQALDQLDQMHGEEFPLVDGYIGTYGTNRQVILWVAVSADSASSERLLASMREKIAKGNSPYTQTGEIKEASRTIYELDGLGQKHFYFQSGELLVWLATDEKLAEQAIRETLKFYP